MRRIVSIILAAALFCLTLTACGSRQKTDLSGAKTIADLKGATIAAQAGTFHLDAVDQIEDVDKKSYPDFTDLLNALKSGAIDGYVAEEPTALEVCGKDDTLTYLPFVNNDTGFTATDAETGIAVAFQTGGTTLDSDNGSCTFRLTENILITAVNSAGYALPSTGGGGTGWFMTAGLLLLCGAALAGICLRKRRDAH